MKWFRNRNTATKLILSFALMAAVAGFVGYQGIRGMGMLDDLLKVNHDKHAVGLDHAQEAHQQVLKLSRGVSNAIIDGVFNDQKALEARIANRKKYEEAFEKEFAALKVRLVREEQKARWTEAEKANRALSEHELRVMELAKNNKLKEAHAALGELRQQSNHVEELIEKLVDGKREVMNKAAEEADASYASTRLLVLGVVAVAIALAMVVGVVIARMIARPLGNAVEVLQVVAQGDFTRKLAVDTTDEVGRMAGALNQAVDGMRTALQEVSVAADHAASASQQLSAASEQLSSGAQEQASSLEETAASLEEITGTVKQNADNARQANQLAVGSRDVAEKGGQVVADAVQSMNEINKSSKKIADIITTIDEIAFQTNLLALNAAVEAARAGEQGRGFAVVASEVRNLAQRSATAAKEIKGLIEDSVQKVEAGSGLVNKSGETLNEIVGSVKRVTDIIAEIAAASHEQTTGIDQVNKAVTQMDQVTQANAAQTEELSSTAQSLAAQAQQLQALVARFKLGEGATAARRVAVHGATRSGPTPKVGPEGKGLTRAVVAKPNSTKLEPALVEAYAPATNGNGSARAKGDGFEEF